MSLITPAVLTSNLIDFDVRLRRVRPFTRRLHVDVADGTITDSLTLGLGQIHGISGIPLDLHLMFERPQDQLDAALALKPSLVIIHAEANCDHAAIAAKLHAAGVKAGLAVMPDATINSVRDLLPLFDHVLIFTGDHLGGHSETFCASCLPKIAEAKSINPQLEVSVDGDVSSDNAAAIAAAGADILCVGGAINHAPNPELAYDVLVKAAN